jgi:type IV pilus assembly protein PilW
MIHVTRNTQAGLSLIELMVAMTLTIIVAAAMISLFINAKQNYRINENMSRLQENARYAVSFLARDLRSADYRACPCPTTDDDAICQAEAYKGADKPIEVQDAGEDAISGTDTVTIRWIDRSPDPADPPLTLQDYCDLDLSDVVTEDQQRIYDIRTGSTGQPALFRNGVELVEGIEDLQLLFGEDTDSDDVPNYYVDAASVSEMSQVVSIRVNLIASTMDLVAVDEDGVAGDLDRAFTTTVTLRNRLP